MMSSDIEQEETKKKPQQKQQQQQQQQGKKPPPKKKEEDEEDDEEDNNTEEEKEENSEEEKEVKEEKKGGKAASKKKDDDDDEEEDEDKAPSLFFPLSFPFSFSFSPPSPIFPFLFSLVRRFFFATEFCSLFFFLFSFLFLVNVYCYFCRTMPLRVVAPLLRLRVPSAKPKCVTSPKHARLVRSLGTLLLLIPLSFPPHGRVVVRNTIAPWVLKCSNRLRRRSANSLRSIPLFPFPF